MKHLSRVMAFVMCLTGLPGVGHSEVVFEDQFNDPGLGNWSLWGSPSPQWGSSVYDRTGIFDNNGDANNASGAVSNQTFDFSNGFVLESEILLDFSDPNGCWARPVIGIANPTYDPSWDGYNGYLGFGFDGNGQACWCSDPLLRGHMYIRGDYATDTGWEHLGGGDCTQGTIPPEFLADAYNGQWHVFRIEAGPDHIPRFYFDGNLIYTGTAPITNSAFTGPRPIYIGACSSGSAGKGYHNWVRLSTPPAVQEAIVFTYTLNNDADIWIMDSDGSNAHPLLARAGSNESAPAISHQGNRIAFLSNYGGRGEVWIMNSDGSNPLQITHSTDPWLTHSGPSWFPLDSLIAYAIRYESWGSLVIRGVHPDGTGDRLLIDSPNNLDCSPLVNPVNGCLIAHHSDPGDWFPDADTWISDIWSGTHVTLVDGTLNEAGGPYSWSSDGSQITLVSMVLNPPVNVWRINTDGTGLTQLTAFSGDTVVRCPAWSPDNSRIVCNYSTNGYDLERSICVMNSDGSGFHELYQFAAGSVYGLNWGLLHPSLGAYPRSLDFGLRDLYSDSAQQVTLYNPTASAIQIPIINHTQSAFVVDTIGLNGAVAAHSTFVIPVTFSPSASGSFRDTILIITEISGNDTIRIPLHGEAAVIPMPVDSLVIKKGPMNGIELRWAPVTHSISGQPLNDVGYVIYGSIVAEGPFTPFGFTTSTTYQHPFILNTQEIYFYYVEPYVEGQRAEAGVLKLIRETTAER